MIRRVFLPMLVIAVSALVYPVFAQTEQKTTPESKLIEFHMALLKRGPKWTANNSGPVFEQHVTYVTSMLESGRAVIAGPIQDDP